MARDPQGALTALQRFGFGARGGAAGDFAAAASDPRGFLKADLARPTGALLDVPNLQPSAVLAQQLFSYQADVKAQRAASAEAQALKPADAALPVATQETMQPSAMPPEVSKAQPQPQNIIQKTYRAEALARIQRASIAEAGFVERLVAFWSNHFCVSAGKGELGRMWAGVFEREAIRPHVLGHFGEMLQAVEQHPAMLFFLDNQQSVGPNSRAGQNGKRGLNENLAREIMELHTLGVGSGYTQADVTSLARIITGWTFAGRDGRLGTPGTFVFNANAHEPGAQMLLGKTYDAQGVAQGEAALADIARQPATARHIARKFAQAFVADAPSDALVARLEGVFRKTDGDLKALAFALVDADDAWRAPLTKIRTPYEYLIAIGRLLARFPEDSNRYLGSLSMLGQPLWTPPGPNGFPDQNAAWAAPENIKLRLDVAAQVAARIPGTSDPRDMLEIVAGDAASKETRQTIARAESKQQAFALLLMSPEFQRR